MSQCVPTCSKGEDGNNASSSPSSSPLYKYDFVLNNYTEREVCQIKDTIKRLCKKGGFGEEVGESGTPHLQGYISLIKKQRITGLLKEPGFARASFRAVRNENALIDYIQKDGNTWTHGFPKPVKIIENLHDWQKDAEALLIADIDDNRTIHWWWEDIGGVGKSQFAKYMIVKYKTLYCSSGKYADLCNLVFNTDMNECNTVIFDIPRNQGGKVSYDALESIKNGIICNTKYETGTKIFNSPKIIVFANKPPENLNGLSTDRWKIVNIREKYFNTSIQNDETHAPG